MIRVAVHSCALALIAWSIESRSPWPAFAAVALEVALSALEVALS